MSNISPCRECIWDSEKAAEICARHDAVIFAAQAGREEAGRSENGLCEESGRDVSAGRFIAGGTSTAMSGAEVSAASFSGRMHEASVDQHHQKAREGHDKHLTS
jgi:hypothetical protein